MRTATALRPSRCRALLQPTSEVLGFADVALNSGTSSITEGSGWTELSDIVLTGFLNWQTQSRTASTSTTVAWQDAATGSDPLEGVFCALEIKAAAGGGGTTPISRDKRSGDGGMRDMTGGMTASQIHMPALRLPGRHWPPPGEPLRTRAPNSTRRPAFVRGVSF
jgi:hypothetical protein